MGLRRGARGTGSCCLRWTGRAGRGEPWGNMSQQGGGREGEIRAEEAVEGREVWRGVAYLGDLGIGCARKRRRDDGEDEIISSRHQGSVLPLSPTPAAAHPSSERADSDASHATQHRSLHKPRASITTFIPAFSIINSTPSGRRLIEIFRPSLIPPISSDRKHRKNAHKQLFPECSASKPQSCMPKTPPPFLSVVANDSPSYSMLGPCQTRLHDYACWGSTCLDFLRSIWPSSCSRHSSGREIYVRAVSIHARNGQKLRPLQHLYRSQHFRHVSPVTDADVGMLDAVFLVWRSRDCEPIVEPITTHEPIFVASRTLSALGRGLPEQCQLPRHDVARPSTRMHLTSSALSSPLQLRLPRGY
ncbi:hypothetical protein OH76DRAFT_10661 [Lentinus brumalis]|uniref:Uncharacterized protein n=1 Tax=Lentinus brumalis TaxID=2498619 RepID=A0A371DWY1_9APHY|nr:hypothetical protein OH76DRAFT_10661 [Polyporus brumalis]